MKLHLVDATYELFRAHFAPRPRIKGRDGTELTAVVGLVWTLLALLRDEGATHVGCATDRIIRSFRNEMYAGYKTEAGVPAELLAQFPIAELAMDVLGVTVWSMLEHEADDALATAAARWADDPNVQQILICTPDKDLAQCVRDERVVLRDRRRDRTYGAAAVVEHWGVAPESIPDYLALVGDSADGYPGLAGWGKLSAAAVLRRYRQLEAIPARASEWDVRVRNAPVLAATLRDHWQDALLYRQLAVLRIDSPIPQRDAEELRWQGADRSGFEAFCDTLGLDRLRAAPHRWRD